ncbi:MAG: efflux RND transporter permease subunit [Cyanobacteria bacterium P01_H01_bin.74]
MWIADVCVKRPVLATVISILMVLFGAVSYTFLTVREYPDIDPPIVSVSTVYTGANAGVMETTVTERLEEELIGIEGVRSMTSVSNEGNSNVVLEFELERDVNVAAQDVRDRVNRARNNLPNDVEEPIITKQDSDASAIIWMGLAGENYTPLQITDYADRYIKNELQTVDGVSQIIIGGAREYSMRLWLDPQKMASRKISVTDVERALQNKNVEVPSGRVEGKLREFTIKTIGELKSPEAFNRLIIKAVNGKNIYLSDIGRAEIGARDTRSFVRLNGMPAVGLGIVKQSKANTLDVAKAIKKKVPDIIKRLPPGMTLRPAYDSSIYIQKSIDEVVESLIVAFFLVVVVVYLFLQSARATFIPAISIPISLIATFSIMILLDYSINTITLLGMTLAIGLVVDDTIVVLENIYRRIEKGETPKEAAIKGTREIGFAIIATTAVLVAVFLPILFLGGILGRILKEFAVVMAGSVLISGFVSLSLTPMLCAKLLKAKQPSDEARQNRWGIQAQLEKILEASNRTIENSRQKFSSSLSRLINKKRTVTTVVLVLAFISMGLYVVLPREFLPTEDQGNIYTIITAPEGSTVDYTDISIRKAEQVLKALPELKTVFSVLGLTNGQTNSGILFSHLVDERSRKAQTIVSDLLPKMLAIPEALVFPITPPSSPTASFGKPIEMAIQSTGSIEDLNTVMQIVKNRAEKEIFGLINLDTDLKLNKPQVEIEVDREKAAALGVSVRDVARTMQVMFGGLDLSSFQLRGKRYDVMVQAETPMRLSPSQLDGLYVGSDKGTVIPLTSVINRTESVAPNALNHYNRFRSITLSGALLPIPGISLGSVLEQMQAIATEELQPGMKIAWKGEAREFFEANTATFFAFALALLIVFLVLAAQFESFIDPVIVILTVPLAMAGALFTLFVLSYVPVLIKLIPVFANWQTITYGLNIYSQIGLVLLVGLVTKNGILIVEFANQIREDHPEKSIRAAVLEAAQVRFRPIVMTSIATIFGAIPIAVGLGSGIDGRKPMGAVIIGGMFFATFLTLYVIPMAYEWVKARRERQVQG